MVVHEQNCCAQIQKMAKGQKAAQAVQFWAPRRARIERQPTQQPLFPAERMEEALDAVSLAARLPETNCAGMKHSALIVLPAQSRYREQGNGFYRPDSSKS